MDAERVARNDDTFRQANERLAGFAATELPPEEQGRTPFICECADPGCTKILHVALEDYRGVRAHPRRFVVAPGHEGSAGDASRIVDTRQGYLIVEKTGRAGDLAVELA
jgi:hypothetical protein